MFLMAISLPKILIHIAWSVYRNVLYDHVYGWKSARLILKEETIQDALKPEKQLERLAKETETYTKELKMPMIELLSALILLQFSSSRLEVDSDAAGALLLLKIAIVLAMALPVIVLVWNFTRMRKVTGGPLA